MAKNISLLGADYPAVPAVQLPQTGGGTATFYDIESVTYRDTTTATGAVAIKNEDRGKRFLGALLYTGAPGFVFRRDEGYFTLFNNSMQPLSNTEVSFIAYFVT